MSTNVSSQITGQEGKSAFQEGRSAWDSFSKKHPSSLGIILVASSGFIYHGCERSVAAIEGISPLHAGVFAISAMSLSVINQVVEKLQKKYDIKDHKVMLIDTAAAALVTVAALIAYVTLGILGPVGIGLFAGSSGLCLLYGLGCAYASYKATLAPLAHPQAGVAR